MLAGVYSNYNKPLLPLSLTAGAKQYLYKGIA